MAKDSTSADKIEQLRQVTNCAIPNTQIRKVLIRCGGDLNAAAAMLIAQIATAPPNPVAPATNSVAARNQPPPQPRPSHQPPVSAHPRKIPTERPHQPQHIPSNTSKVNHNNDISNAHVNVNETPTISPGQLKEAKRKAWRQFYVDKREEAIAIVGSDKRKLDQYITTLWKQMGSANRKQYIASFAFVQPATATSATTAYSATADENTRRPISTQPEAANVNNEANRHDHSQHHQHQQNEHHVKSSNIIQSNSINTSHNDDSQKILQAGEDDNTLPPQNINPDQQPSPAKHEQNHDYNDAQPSHQQQNSIKEEKRHAPITDNDDLKMEDAESKIEGEKTTENVSHDEELDISNMKASNTSKPSQYPSLETEIERAKIPSIHQSLPSVAKQEPTAAPPPPLSPNSVEWPRKLMTRLCRGVMLTQPTSSQRKKKQSILKVGDNLVLEPQTSMKDSLNGRIVRFIKGGREMGRLAADVGNALSPALQSGFVFATCKVIEQPNSTRMFAEVILEIDISISEDAFLKGFNTKDEEKIEGGYDDDEDRDGDGDGDDYDGDDNSNKKKKKLKWNNKNKNKGIDINRMNIVQMITLLNICSTDEDIIQTAHIDSDTKNNDTADNADNAGKENDGDEKLKVNSEEDAEAYYRTVNKIDEEEAKNFKTSRFLICSLRDYQKVGVKWMISREKYGNSAKQIGSYSNSNSDSTDYMINPLWKKKRFPDGGIFYMNTSTGSLSLKSPIDKIGGPYGGILADEMGLGKTVQCIACIVHDIEELRGLKNKDEPALESNDDVENQRINGTKVEERKYKQINENDKDGNDLVDESIPVGETVSNDLNDNEDTDDKSTQSPNNNYENEEEHDNLNFEDEIGKQVEVEENSEMNVEDDSEMKVDSVKEEPKKEDNNDDHDEDDDNADDQPVRRSTRSSILKVETKVTSPRRGTRTTRQPKKKIKKTDSNNDLEEHVASYDDGESSEDDVEDKDWCDDSTTGTKRKNRDTADEEDNLNEEDDNGVNDDDFEATPKKTTKERPRKRLKLSSPTNNDTFMKPTKKKKKLVLNKWSEKNERKGGTLIICPASLLTQWANEFSVHVTPNFIRCVTHYGPTRGQECSSINLNSCDVVITTYGTVASEYIENDSSGEENGIIFQVEWRRIVLDEAHTIKSRVTKWAKSIYQLKSKYKWCVTGTVIHNHINDVFSLLHFLKMRPWSSWSFWTKGIVENLESKNLQHQHNTMCLLRDIISSITLRRKKSTKDSNGQNIIQLTNKKVDLVFLKQSREEEDFYQSLHQRSKTKFDSFVAQGKVLNNYACVLELLLRLRQACDHPYLVFSAAPSKDTQLLKDKDKLYKKFLQNSSSTDSKFIEQMLKDSENSDKNKNEICPLCLDIIEDGVAPQQCGHAACRHCIISSLEHSKKCPICRKTISQDSLITLPRSSRFSIDLNKQWKSSVKIETLLKEIREREDQRRKLHKNHTTNKKGIGKSVIFSQFTSMLDLVEFALHRENFKTLRIDGSVNQKKRAQTLKQFAEQNEFDKDSCNVLLVSLRTGGVGLNLVAASHAILLDIHWNPQVDAQAEDRIHRYGQTLDVTIKRYLIKDSVEEKLLQVQKRKQELADGALDSASDADRRQARLSELHLLFGP